MSRLPLIHIHRKGKLMPKKDDKDAKKKSAGKQADKGKGKSGKPREKRHTKRHT